MPDASRIIYLLSERILRRTYTEPLVDIAVPADSQAVVEGYRLAALRGGSGGCHGSEIEGGVFVDQLVQHRPLVWSQGCPGGWPLRQRLEHLAFDARLAGVPWSLLEALWEAMDPRSA